jgi:hypothetical protein
VGVPIEQDAAYWEARLVAMSTLDTQDRRSEQQNGVSTVESALVKIMLGVATRKDSKFYHALDQQDDDGTLFTRSVPALYHIVPDHVPHIFLGK